MRCRRSWRSCGTTTLPPILVFSRCTNRRARLAAERGRDPYRQRSDHAQVRWGAVVGIQLGVAIEVGPVMLILAREGWRLSELAFRDVGAIRVKTKVVLELPPRHRVELVRAAE